jgi:hypothetical protein
MGPASEEFHAGVAPVAIDPRHQEAHGRTAAEIGPFFGWLCTRIGYYPEETLLLTSRAHFRGGNLRPTIEREPTDHPLAVDRREGITLAKAWEIVHDYERQQENLNQTL